MSEDTDTIRWLKDLMAARLDGGISDLSTGRMNASTAGRIRRNNHDQFLHLSNPPILPALAEDASLASPAEASADEKGFTDEERMVEGDDKNIYPSIPILVTLTVALMIAIFMIGLDTNIIGESTRLGVRLKRSISHTVSCCKEIIGPTSVARNRYPEDHKPLPQLGRRRLVRVRIPSDPAVVAIDFWKIILTLQHQMDIHRRASYLRDRIFHVRQCAFLHGLHHRESHLRYRVCRHLFRKSHHQREHGTA